MFSKIAIFATITLALSVAAAPIAGDGGDEYCSIDEIYCCNQVEQSQSTAGANIARTIVGLDVQSLTGLIGANCSPITVIGTANGGTWSVTFLLFDLLVYLFPP